MYKKIGILMFIVCIALVGYLGYIYKNTDSQGPVISFKNEDLVYEDGMSEDELTEDVVAIDDEDGNVSDSVIIEAVYTNAQKEATIIYAAKDSKNNVTKCKRIIEDVTVREEEEEETETDSETEKASAKKNKTEK